MILTSYFDESGTHAGSPITVMGGVMGNALQWSRFEAKVKCIQKKYGFQVFHAKDFKARTGEFQGWPVGKCLALLKELLSLVSTGLMEGVHFSLDNSAYKAEYREGEHPRKLRLDSAYGLCFRVCLIHLALDAAKRCNLSKANKLNVVLESGHKNSGDALRIFDEVRKETRSFGIDLLSQISFGEKKTCNPLMVVDFLAHSVFNHDVRTGTTFPVDIPEPQILLPSHTKGKTGLTRLAFGPGGLAEFKTNAIAQMRTRAALLRQPS